MVTTLIEMVVSAVTTVMVMAVVTMTTMLMLATLVVEVIMAVTKLRLASRALALQQELYFTSSVLSCAQCLAHSRCSRICCQCVSLFFEILKEFLHELAHTDHKRTHADIFL